MDICKEIEFWTLIMRDHGEFQYTSLVSTETDAINRTKYFINLFESLNADARSNQTSVTNLISKSKSSVTQFIDFKRYMLAGLMTCNIKLNMAPSFLNHMINEALEFFNLLNLADGTTPFNPVLENLRLHIVWLPDASGHASNIASGLDAIEFKYINEADEYIKKFDCLFKKAFEMYHMYERTGLENGALHHFNEEVIKTLTEFIEFLDKIESSKNDCKIFSTGTFSPLIPNHMMREEGYYIYKINELNNR